MHTYLLKNILVANTGAAGAPNNRKKLLLENCTPITDCISKINNTQIDNVGYINAVITIYN